jgi:plasmid stability protein
MGENINLDDALVTRLKQRAQEQGLSLEETVRRILSDALPPPNRFSRMTKEELGEELRRIREMNPSITEPPFAEDLIREGRDER